MKQTIDFSTGSLRKLQEEISGNIVEVTEDDRGVTAFLADGEGEGTGASVTAAFFSRVARKLLQNGDPIESTVRNIAEIYADTTTDDISPFGLTTIRLWKNGFVSFACLNSPTPVLIRRDKRIDYSFAEKTVKNFTIVSSEIKIKSGTSIICFNDGLLSAGRAHGTGWSRRELELFLEAAYQPRNFGAERITQMLLFAAKSLEQDRPARDVSVLTLNLSENRA